METESSVLPAIDVENENQLEYANHVHPLTLCEIDEDCCICFETCLGRRTCGCNQCGLYLHESCTKIEIPQEIHHYFHPHSLRLSMKESKGLDSGQCQACYRLLAGLMFECLDCEFYMDVECALLPTKLEQDGCTIDHIQHLNHGHPLILCDEEKKYEDKFCSGCKGGLSTRPCFSYDTFLLSEGSESIYGCLWCGFFLHERCARLPLEIDSRFHPGHSLELIWSFSNYPICQGCHRTTVNSYTYQCPGSCNFVLGVECAFLRAPVLKLEAHKHLLTLFPSVNPVLTCHICDETCDSSNIFRCIDCDYNLHLHCGPLPCSIKDKCHIDSYGDPHPLKLMYAFVEDGYEDDIVYCDVCEQPRDPDQCVYYCKDCSFFAELKCVEPEVLRSLNGERGNVKLKTANKTRIRVGAKLISNVITDNVETDSDNETEDIGAKYLEVKLHENFFSGCYTDEEYDQLIEIFEKARVQLRSSPLIFQESNKALCARVELAGLLDERTKELDQTSLVCYSSDEESDNGENSMARLLTGGFKQLMRELDHIYCEEEELLEFVLRGDYNIVQIGEHKIVQDSASVLKGLLHKYGDFTAKSKLSERLKAIFLTMFCEVIRKMCLTNVREVKNEVLMTWWKSLKLVQHAGFEIEFAIDQLYKVMQASFGIQIKTSYREMKSKVDKSSHKMEEEEAELEAKMRELEVKKRELEAKKIELEEEKSDVDKCKYAMEFSSSPVLKEILKHVSELKWKKAWDGSPIMFH